MPLNVSGMTDQSGWRSGAAARITTHTARPITGMRSSSAGNRRLAMTLARIAATRIAATIADADPLDLEADRRFPDDRRVAMLLERRRNGEDRKRDDGGDIGLHHRQRTDAVDPHHRGRGVADDAAGAAGVRRRDDRGEVADVDFAAEHMARHGAADQRRRDVVEEARQHEHDHQQRDAALPVVGQDRPASRRARGSSRNGARAAQIPSAAGTGWPGSPIRAACAARSRRGRRRT